MDSELGQDLRAGKLKFPKDVTLSAQVSEVPWENSKPLVNIRMAKKNTQSPEFASGNSHQHRQVLFHCLYTESVKIISAEFLVKCISSEQHHLGHYLGIVSAIKWKGITPFMKQAPVRRALRRQSCGPSRDDVCVEPGAHLLLLGSCRGRAIPGQAFQWQFRRPSRFSAHSEGSSCLGRRLPWKPACSSSPASPGSSGHGSIPMLARGPCFDLAGVGSPDRQVQWTSEQRAPGQVLSETHRGAQGSPDVNWHSATKGLGRGRPSHL